jgi:integrase
MRGTPLQPSNFRQRVWEPALRLAGLERGRYRFHDLRHTCVSRLVAAGADVKLVQAVAGLGFAIRPPELESFCPWPTAPR